MTTIFQNITTCNAAANNCPQATASIEIKLAQIVMGIVIIILYIVFLKFKSVRPFAIPNMSNKHEMLVIIVVIAKTEAINAVSTYLTPYTNLIISSLNTAIEKETGIHIIATILVIERNLSFTTSTVLLWFDKTGKAT